jgi:hypothetical protein
LIASKLIVGWVERSETHQSFAQKLMGFAARYPSYELLRHLGRKQNLPT